MAVTAEMLSEEGELLQFEEQWDDLACRLSAPYSSPSWMLAWWRHSRPSGAALRAVVATEGERLLGLAPLWVADPRRGTAHYDVLAARLSLPATWLVEPDRAVEATRAITGALAASRPRPVLLRLEDSGSTRAAITNEVVASWPGLVPHVQVSESVPMPLALIGEGGFEGWLSRRRSGFRKQLRRRSRRAEEAGGRIAHAGRDDLEPALDAYLELHAARWRVRGGSSVLIPGIKEMLLDVGRAPKERLRVFTFEFEDRIVAAEILVAAGGEVTAWSGGFDEETQWLAPSTQLLAHAIEDACARKQEVLNLGPGGQPYKGQLADTEDVMEVRKVLPRGRSYPTVRLRMAWDNLRANRVDRARARTRPDVD